MSTRRLPVRPNLEQLRRQAKELLHAYRDGEAAALAEFEAHHPGRPVPAAAQLADAQLVLARSYSAPSWPRLVQAVELVNAIWNDDREAVSRLITQSPALIHEPALIRRDSNWGMPLSYAANLGRDEIIAMLYEHGARDLRHALERAALQGQVTTARLVHKLAGSPTPTDDSLGGPAYTLNVSGTEFLLSLGVRVVDELGQRLAPVDVVLQTDSRNPKAKHRILELYASQGIDFPDTPVMALHRGRLDLLEDHLRRDPTLLTRTFRHREIFPKELGCDAEVDATVGTPLDGTTLLHICIEYGEMEIFQWLLDQGMDPNIPARLGASGFGGYTPLFCAVVSQPNFWMNHGARGPFSAPFAEKLLERGADPNVRASIWKCLHPGHGDPTRREYHNVTPLSWGRRFHPQIFVSEPALALITAAGGVE